MSTPGAYHEVAVTRAKELRLRVGLALVIAGGVWAMTHTYWSVLWYLLAIGAQFLDLALTSRLRRDPDFALTPRQEAGYLAMMAFNVGMYSSIAPYCWLTGGLEGHIFALVLPVAGLVNVALQAQSSPKILLAGSVPHAVVLMALPVISLAIGETANPVGMVFVLAAVVLYLAHLVIAVIRNLRAARALTDALSVAQAERTRALEANAAKSDFLATMSHEIRTPLNGVLGMAQAMEGDSLPRRQKDRLAVIRQSGEVLLLLLNDLLDISKIEAAKLELNDGVLNLDDLALQAQAAFAPLAAAKNVALTVTATPEVAGQWCGDTTRVRQIFYNLLSNAVKFTEAGSITASLGLHMGEVVIQVADTGPGVPSDRLPNLFERFVQADASTTRRYGGSGLGLSISRELARLMGGDISAQSVVGAGSVFTVTLPLRRRETPEHGTPAPAAPVDQQCDLRILVAEDNPTNQLVITTLLEQVGIFPTVVCDGAQAVEAWRDGRWDVILMDIQMPVMDGLTALATIRSVEAAEGRIRTPIVALTANAMDHHTAEYLAAGMDQVAAKPIQFQRLIATINAVLEPVDNAAASAAA